MNARIQLSFPRSPFIFQLSHDRNSWHWWAVHRREPDWRAIFAGILQLVGIEFTESPDRLQLDDGAGEVAWHRCWCGTTIQLQLLKFSERKRNLVAAALLKAARHSQLKERYAKSQ
jgi:hypothetical protein